MSDMNSTRDSYKNVFYDANRSMKNKTTTLFFVVVNTIVSLGMECRERRMWGKKASSAPRIKHRNGVSSTSSVASCRPVREARGTIRWWDTTEVRHLGHKVAYLMNPRRLYVRAGSMSITCRRVCASTGVVCVSRARRAEETNR